MKRRYAYRPIVQLVGKSDAQRQQCARDAAKAVDNQLMQSPSHRQSAAAHFAGFWADESEDGAGDEQKVCAVTVAVAAATHLSPYLLAAVQECLPLLLLTGMCFAASPHALRPSLRCDPLLQVYVGDYVLVTDESSRAGSSLGEVVELYQDPAVGCYHCSPLWSTASMCVHLVQFGLFRQHVGSLLAARQQTAAPAVLLPEPALLPFLTAPAGQPLDAAALVLHLLQPGDQHAVQQEDGQEG